MSVGRPPPRTPGHAVYAAKAFPSARKLAGSLGRNRQQVAQWINGEQWVPLAVVRQVEELTAGEIKLGAWAKVRDREKGQYWEHGLKSSGPTWGRPQGQEAG